MLVIFQVYQNTLINVLFTDIIIDFTNFVKKNNFKRPLVPHFIGFSY